MVLALVWLGVFALVAFWSLAAWASYALTAWALGSAAILTIGLAASVLVVRYRGRPARAPGLAGLMPLKNLR